MTEDTEKAQSVEDSQTDAEPKSHIDAQREEALNPSPQNPASDPDVPQDAPKGYQPQVPLQPEQSDGIEERPGETVVDVEEEENDQSESSADVNDDEAVDDPEPGTPG